MSSSVEEDILLRQWRNIVPFDLAAVTCFNCPQVFSTTHLVHHCRHCGRAFCGSCSQEIYLKDNTKRRLCEACFLIKAQSPSPRSELEWILKRIDQLVISPAKWEPKASVQRSLHGLHFLIIIVGSRGDVQPFIAFGKEMIKLNHRITIATHVCFRDTVKENHLEFYPLPGDPEDLMELMVSDVNVDLLKNKLPNHRDWIRELLNASWKACNETEDGKPTIIDAIISNPPSFVGPHLAEKLWCPLFMAFTMPWSATTEFCSPFINKDKGKKANYYSYGTVDRAIWTGMKDLINHWRSKVLHILPIRTQDFSGHLLLQSRKVPFIYCFSPSLVPKPDDWGSYIHISGFWFMEKSEWQPEKELQEFLDNGAAPIFVGFGSIKMNDPEKFTSEVLEGIEKAEQRAIVQSGWTKMESKDSDSENIFYLDSAPHDALFPHCSAVIHHGGAGTTANGLRAGKPTLIVPFFGDQYFWGKVISKREAGAKALPKSKFTADKFSERIKETLKCTEKAKEIKNDIDKEDGIQKAIHIIQAYLESRQQLYCDVCLVLGDTNPARVICLDCRLKFCSRDNHVAHRVIPNMMHHRRHRNRIVHWNTTDNNSGLTFHSFVDGVEAVASSWKEGISDVFKEPIAGAKEGPIGAIKGVGRGISSLVGNTVTSPVNFATTTAEGLAGVKYEEIPHGVIELEPNDINRAKQVMIISAIQKLIEDKILNKTPHK